MIRFLLPCCLALLMSAAAHAQKPPVQAHSHNDYLQAQPFTLAFARNFGSIEADVFERNGALYVAHTAKEIDTAHTLRQLYLEPLQQAITTRQGIFSKRKQHLLLLIDFKTAAEPTMEALLQLLGEYPTIANDPNVRIAISGNRPAPSEWKDIPSFILFDGLPQVPYTLEQLQRIPLFSDNFRSYSDWNGRSPLTPAQQQGIVRVLEQAHAANKPFRFWNSPDGPEAWKVFQALGVDFINTDKVNALADFLEKSR
ncbi:phosphatidylinositol-specific phospholipase C/glycerophosphodiester phosphodiesterase family protein [Chitinophaga lutea]